MVFSFIDTEFATYFFDSLLNAKRFSKEEEIFNKIYRYFLNTNLSFKSDINAILEKFNDYEQDLLKQIFFNQLTTGRGNNKVVFKETKPFNYLRRKNVYKELKLPFANYWIQNAKYPIEEYETSNPYHFFNAEQIEQRHSLINVNKKWWVGPADKSGENIFKSWEDLSDYKHNFFDIIISDRYCLNNETGIRSNIPVLIKNFSSQPENIKNILLFVKNDAVIDKSLEKAYQILKDEFDNMGMNNVNIQIFASYKTPHDRFIITNSFYLSSGDSIDYFNPDGSYKTNGTTLEINDLLNAKGVVNQQLKKLKEIYNNNKSKSVGAVSGNNILEIFDT